MSKHDGDTDHLRMEEEHGASLVPCDAGDGIDAGPLVDDEDGSFAFTETAFRAFERSRACTSELRLTKPCSLKTLDGSWLLQIESVFPSLYAQVRGPMRIEASRRRLRVSGDVYVKRYRSWSRREQPEVLGTVVTKPFIIERNWYPAFPQSEYRWYFRSRGVSYYRGKLVFKFTRHLWSTRDQEFTTTDNGYMEFECEATLIYGTGYPQPTVEMEGTAVIGGKKYAVKATKTSPYYRGCLVEVDVMTNRSWPASATSCDGGSTFSFTGVYRAHGMDFRTVVNEVNVPEDTQLTRAELQTLLSTHRSLSPGGDNWRLWILVGSKENGTYGVMFDQTAPHREGVVGYFDPTMPDWPEIEAGARDQKLGDVPLAFLRTLIHEAGHAFNLYHPKSDVHLDLGDVGTTIMNQTGDVTDFATETHPYPCNATMGFMAHNRTSLIHSPDPQVKPGWKEFGWGHGSVWSGVGEPVDALGLAGDAPVAGDLRLDLELPNGAHRGEAVVAVVTVTNVGNEVRTVPSGLNLAQDDLHLMLTTPDGLTRDVRDVVLLCGRRYTRELQPGDSFSRPVQLFYSNRGLTFDQPGRYRVQAELDVPGHGVVTSAPVETMIRPAATAGERDMETLMTDQGVAASIALGDFGADTKTQEKLEQIVDRFGDSDTGAACAMVLANSLLRDFRDVRANRVTRPADREAAARALDVVLKDRAASMVAMMASAIVSPREITPLMDEMANRIGKEKYTKKDKNIAMDLLANHLT